MCHFIKKLTLLTSIILTLLLSACSAIQGKIVTVKIAEKTGALGPCEPSIAISRKNPKNIVAGAVLDYVYRSEDGGLTWSESQLQSKYGVRGDPCIISDLVGNFYYFHLSDPDQRGWDPGNERFLDRIVCQKSEDNGISWKSESYMGLIPPKDQDKEWAVYSPTNNQIYATWTKFDKYGSPDTVDKSDILFSRAVPESLVWSEPVRINQFSGNCLDDDRTTEGAVPAAGPDGEVYVAWSYNNKIYFDRSKDLGKTWLDEDIIITDQPGGWSTDIPGIGRCNGMPVTVCDNSAGDHNGTIYVNWTDTRNGENDTDVWLSKSVDGGDTWSAPLRVNDDEPGKHQFLTWIAVDQKTGYIYIVFYDRRNHNDLKTDVYLAYSVDGGATFLNKKITKKPFTPNTAAFFGDYNNIDAHDGLVRPIWTQLDGRTLSVWTALIRINGKK